MIHPDTMGDDSIMHDGGGAMLSRLADAAEEASRRERELRGHLHEAHVQLAERDDRIARLIDPRRPSPDDLLKLEQERDALLVGQAGLDAQRAHAGSECERLSAELAAAQAALAESELRLADSDQRLGDSELRLADSEHRLADGAAMQADTAARLAVTTATLAETVATLDELRSTRAWRLAGGYWRLRDRFLAR
jgi:chromosome segregation ATPase